MTVAIQTGVVAVDGAEIYFERRGSGPALLLISGGGGDAGYYSALGDLLADEYTVLTYDVRGNSRSRLTVDPTPLRMAQESADARAVLAHNGFGSALVFGSSSGAVIALDLAARHPEAVDGVVVHEPPVITVLPDAATYVGYFDEIERIRDREGVWPAYVCFIALVLRGHPAAVFRYRAGRWLAGSALRAVTRLLSWRRPPAGSARRGDTTARILRNTPFFVTYEMRPIVDYVPDLAALRRIPVVMAGGHDSRRLFYCRTGEVIAERLGVELVEFPGAHSAYFDDAPPFAAKLRTTLTRLRERASD
ncbi:MAG TPA: alpha/beta hydrolase [Jatrophihabitantaceae bacterium]|nr:alpha/beta hydrolase [Jatrophihabitantaceae bacterium]